MSDKIILICEIYGPVVQGEGQHIGVPTVFVRTGGCSFRCAWCDSLYAVLPAFADSWHPMTAEAVVARVHDLAPSPILITLSGGDPAQQKNMGEVIDLLHAQGHSVTIETQGAIFPAWAQKLDTVTLSPKPPSSKMLTEYKQLDRWMALESVALKIVVFDDSDYAYAKSVHQRYPYTKMSLQVGNPDVSTANKERLRGVLLDGLDMLQQRVIADSWYDVAVLPQLHALLYANQRQK